MVHILLLILKIIGIIVLSILGLALLILFFPITYVGKANGNIEEKKITGNIRAGWLFHLLHCRLWIENTEIHYNIRLLGIKIKSSETKEKKKKVRASTPSRRSSAWKSSSRSGARTASPSPPPSSTPSSCGPSTRSISAA